MTPASPPPPSDDVERPYVPLWLRDDDGGTADEDFRRRSSSPQRPAGLTHDRRPRRRGPAHAKRSLTGSILRRPMRLLGLLLAVAVVGLGIRACTSANGGDEHPSAAASEAETSSTSSIPSVAALPITNASVRLLVGGPDVMGNGGDATKALLRRPTSIARLGAGLLVADAGALRLIRGDGVIEQVALPDEAAGFAVDHVAVLSGRDALAVDESTGRMLRLNDVGSDGMTAEIVPATELVSPTAVASAGRGAAFLADPGTGTVWRWTEKAGTTPFVRGLSAPVGISALVGGGLLVADRGSGTVLRVSETGVPTPIAGVAGAADGVTTPVVRLASAPVDVAWDGNARALLVLADSTLVSVPLNPTGRESASVLTEFLRGPIGVMNDPDGPLVVEAGLRRIVRITKDSGGTLAPLSVAGADAWPRFNPKALRAADVVLIDPVGMAIAPDGSVVVADRGANLVWRLDPDGKATRLAGTENWGSTGDNDDAAASALAGPTDVAVGADGTVFVTEAFSGRVRSISTTGALGSVTAIDPTRAPVVVGPVATLGSQVFVGDRYRGGLVPFTTNGSKAKGARPPVSSSDGVFRAVFAGPSGDGGIVAGDAFGTVISVATDGTVATGRVSLPAGAVVKAGATADDGRVVIALAGTSKAFTMQAGTLTIDARPSIGDRPSADIVALARSADGFVMAATGDRAAVATLTATPDNDFARAEPLTSTALGPDSGRPNETPLDDPVSIDSAADESLVITDRGGARVRVLRNGVVSTLAGSGRTEARINLRATAVERSLPDLRDARTLRNGLLLVADGDALLEIDGMGFVQNLPLPRRDGATIRLRSVAEAFDGSIVAVDADGRLLRLGDGPANVLASTPPLARVHVDQKGGIWAITEDRRLVRFRSSKFEEVSLPRDLVVAGFDEAEGRLVVAGTDGSVVESDGTSWDRLAPSTSVAADRRSTQPATPNPTDVAILSDGAVVVADAGRDAVLVYRTR